MYYAHTHTFIALSARVSFQQYYVWWEEIFLWYKVQIYIHNNYGYINIVWARRSPLVAGERKKTQINRIWILLKWQVIMNFYGAITDDRMRLIFQRKTIQIFLTICMQETATSKGEVFQFRLNANNLLNITQNWLFIANIYSDRLNDRYTKSYNENAVKPMFTDVKCIWSSNSDIIHLFHRFIILLASHAIQFFPV